MEKNINMDIREITFLKKNVAKVVYTIDAEDSYDSLARTRLMNAAELLTILNQTYAFTKNDLKARFKKLAKSADAQQNDESEEDDNNRFVFRHSARIIALKRSVDDDSWRMATARDYNRDVKLETVEGGSLEIYVPTLVNIIFFRHTVLGQKWQPTLLDITQSGPVFQFQNYAVTFTTVPAEEIDLTTKIYTPRISNMYSNGFMCTGTTPRGGYSLRELIDFDKFAFLKSRYNNDLTTLAEVQATNWKEGYDLTDSAHQKHVDTLERMLNTKV